MLTVRLSQLSDTLNGNTIGIIATGATYRIDASNNPAGPWTAVSATFTAPANPGAGSRQLWALTATQAYTYYRVFGLSGTTNSAGSLEIRPTGIVGYSASANQIVGCEQDLDHDGLPNNKDLDSDGDGCPDAFEAATYNQSGVTASSGNVQNGTGDTVTSTITKPNAIINGPYGLNGFADVLQSSTDTNSYKFTYTYNQYAVYSHLNLCMDSDNDGIPDFRDIDDDNDGVLDLTEAICPSCDAHYPVPQSRVVWQPFPINAATSVFGSVTRNGETISVVANATQPFNSLLDVIFGSGSGPYVGCPSTAPLTNSMLTSYTANYSVTISFESPVWNPSLMLASYDQSVINFPRPVYVSGVQGTLPLSALHFVHPARLLHV